MTYERLATDAGTWSMPKSREAATIARLVIVGGVLGGSALDGTSAIAIRRPSDYELSRDSTNTGPVETTTTGADAETAAITTSAQLIAELRRISGLTWQHLARLFDVDRRAVHFWASGRPMTDANAEHLARIVALVRELERGDPARVREYLLAPRAGGELALDLLAAKRYDELASPPTPPQVRMRPPAISADAAARRRPPPPAQLLGGTSSPPGDGRLLKGKPIKGNPTE